MGLQEAFFKTDKLVSQANDSICDDSPSQDSVSGANFSILQSDNLVSSFSQISPQSSCKVQDMATVHQPNQYSYSQEVGFNEPINRTGSLELPKYNPRNNYFQAYWKLYSGNEQMMAQIGEIAEDRDELLKAILQVEQFYND